MRDPAGITRRRAGATGKARHLRREQTDAEYRLWYHLRDRALGGHKFSRQVPLGSYIVDFLCRDKHVIVELDGKQHAESPYDLIRTRWLNQHGYSILRFWNHEVLRERGSVLDTILAVLEGRIAAPSPDLRFAPATLSPAGRGTEHAAPARAKPQAPAEIARHGSTARHGADSSPLWGEVPAQRAVRGGPSTDASVSDTLRSPAYE
ncbi:endonuclease domain-containing protein [Afifella sp. JA880]|uniref:endonuclease domain-containing protein n=1 Tax=Afifella sp. JA880 TaxID=2975280 RepID=UPI0021BA4FC6|nr:endonuclease domain-containing protein [Afifella sp. JA880]MCT8268358.1 endonuclease domain-containing protein [Afifella sp. JA880]